MRKMKCIVLAGLLVLALACTSCGSQKAEPVFSAKDNAFTITPQGFIDYINTIVEEQNDSRYWTIPDYAESGKAIEVKSIFLTLTLEANESGNLTKIQLDWDAKRQGTGDNIGLYISGIVYGLTENSDAISTVLSELDMLDTEPPKYETSYSDSGVLYSYSTYGHAQYNTLTITPSSD